MSTGQLWEWVVDQGSDCGPSGVSGDRDRAMAELSRSLISVGEPISGRVVPIRLAEDDSGFAYERFEPWFRADYKGGVIRWQ